MRTVNGRVEFPGQGPKTPVRGNNHPVLDGEITNTDDRTLEIRSRVGSDVYATRAKTSRTYPHAFVERRGWRP